MILRHRFLSVLLVSLSLLGSFVRAADPARPQIGPPPEWVNVLLQADLAAESRAPIVESGTGRDFLHFDEQTNLARQTRTFHTVYRITSQSGLSDGAQISRSFDPSYEALEFHSIRLWRDGAAQDRLAGAEIKVIQQERDLERQMFNGQLSAIVVLADVQVGDIVEYSLTTRGANPVFAGKFIDATNTDWSSPTRFQQTRILVPPGRTLYVRQHGETPVTAATRRLPDGTTEHTWNLRDLSALTSDADTPSWHVQYGYLEFSEYADWLAVREWAQPLYELPASDPAIRAKAQALTAPARTAEAKILALLDFVQRDVRYLGFELGANSHRPHAPTQVFQQRFGDCKDKVMLFRALLAEVGVTAHPVLVHTYRERKLDERLPSPYAFNHVIALVELDGERYWLDPTQSYQRGNLRARDAIYESKGLVIRADAPAGLEIIPSRPEATYRREVVESYSYTDIDQPGTLRLTYRYFGAGANSARSYLANNSRSEIVRDLIDRHARNHAALAAAAPLRSRDDPERNEIEIELDCTVPSLWTIDPANPTAREASFYPWTLQNFIAHPDNITRRSPLALDHPTTQTVRIEVTLLGEWELRDTDREISTDWYAFTSRIRYAAQKLTLDYAWRSRSDHVPASGMQTHIAKLAEIRKTTGYTLAWNTAAAPTAAAAPQEFSLNRRTTALVLAVLVGFVVFGRWLNARAAQPPLLNEAGRFAGISGWLLLPAIGLIFRPVLIVTQLSSSATVYFDERTWAALTTAGLETYQPAVAVLVACELVGNSTLLMLVFLTGFFFFRRKQQAPALYIALLSYQPVLLALDMLGTALVISGQKPDPEMIKSLLQSLVAAAIWIPYFLKSQRVRATFTR
ncbi:MAG: hypothetical protein C0518_00125 [Opitutus sp.]|nr:hypothetical protein [Opitutus sp.]